MSHPSSVIHYQSSIIHHVSGAAGAQTVSQISHFGHEWGRHGSPRAHTRGNRSHALQRAFGTPPGLSRTSCRPQNNQKDKKSQDEKVEDLQEQLENEKERTSLMLDYKYNILHKPILLKMEKKKINL